ncbi:uncharacterized protein [Lolium perenne]|uniref:uncharacterized protein n=1 Tax=Lolium perenne TaxID=4522 RepID=UPI003A99001F
MSTRVVWSISIPCLVYIHVHKGFMGISVTLTIYMILGTIASTWRLSSATSVGAQAKRDLFCSNFHSQTGVLCTCPRFGSTRTRVRSIPVDWEGSETGSCSVKGQRNGVTFAPSVEIFLWRCMGIPMPEVIQLVMSVVLASGGAATY